MQLSIFTLLALLYTCSVFVGARSIPEPSDEDLEDEGYYWRDFAGIIPKDAFPGGTNCNGETTYIGQVLHKDQLIPAKIDPEEGEVVYEWGYKEYKTTKNVKILCTKNPEHLIWIKTGNKHIDNITDQIFVEGGYEDGVRILIGRKQLEDELAVGKVIFGSKQSTLNTTKDGIGYQHGEFEVLAYDPTIKAAKDKKKKDEKYSVTEDELDEEEPNKVIPAKPTDLTCKDGSIVINIYNHK